MIEGTICEILVSIFFKIYVPFRTFFIRCTKNYKRSYLYIFTCASNNKSERKKKITFTSEAENPFIVKSKYEKVKSKTKK